MTYLYFLVLSKTIPKRIKPIIPTTTSRRPIIPASFSPFCKATLKRCHHRLTLLTWKYSNTNWFSIVQSETYTPVAIPKDTVNRRKSLLTINCLYSLQNSALENSTFLDLISAWTLLGGEGGCDLNTADETKRRFDYHTPPSSYELAVGS